MEIAVTDGIKICVQTKFESELSTECNCPFYFSYVITIENNSRDTVQLMRRKWMIFDSNGEHYLVEGEGVVGQKPVIAPGESYTYESACKLTTSIGKMCGIYYMTRKKDNSEICVRIPEFKLSAPFRLN